MFCYESWDSSWCACHPRPGKVLLRQQPLLSVRQALGSPSQTWLCLQSPGELLQWATTGQQCRQLESELLRLDLTSLFVKLPKWLQYVGFCEFISTQVLIVKGVRSAPTFPIQRLADGLPLGSTIKTCRCWSPLQTHDIRVSGAWDRQCSHL